MKISQLIYLCRAYLECMTETPLEEKVSLLNPDDLGEEFRDHGEIPDIDDFDEDDEFLFKHGNFADTPRPPEDLNNIEILELGGSACACTCQHTARDVEPEDVRDVRCPAPIAKIRVTRKALSDMFLMAKAINQLAYQNIGPNAEMLEIHAFCLGEKDNSEYPTELGVIDEIFIPTQELSEVEVRVSEAGLQEAAQRMREQNKRILGWTHSHGQYDVYSSETDDENHRVLLNDTANYVYLQSASGEFRIKYAYGMTVVESEDFMGVAANQFGCGMLRLEETEFEIIGADYDGLEKELRLEELKEHIENVVTVLPPQEEEENTSEMLDNLIAQFIDKFLPRLASSQFTALEANSKSITPENMPVISKILKTYDSLLIEGAKESLQELLVQIMERMRKLK